MRRTMITHLFFPLVVLCLAACACACGGGGGGGGGGAAQDAEPDHIQMLEAFGANTGLPDDRTDLAGDPIPCLKPTCEIFWMNGDTRPSAQIHEDAKDDPDTEVVYPLAGDLAWTKGDYKNSVAADIDGDGFDEIVIAYLVPIAGENDFDLHLKTIDKADPAAAGTYTETDQRIWQRIGDRTATTNLVKRQLPSMAKGDLDGDDREEVVIGLWDLYVVKLSPTSSRFEVTQRQYKGARPGLFVAAGDLNENGRDEIVVTEEDRCDVFRWTLGGGLTYAFTQNQTIPDPTGDIAGRDYDHGLRVAVGDIDQDGRNEVVFRGRMEGSSWLYVTAMRLAPAGDRFESLDFHIRNNPAYGGHLVLALLDFDGDGRLEILAGDWLFRYSDDPQVFGGASLSYGIFDSNHLKAGNAEILYVGKGDPFNVGKNYGPRHVAVGDVNGDRIDDIVLARATDTTVAVEAWVHDSVGGLDYVWISPHVNPGTQFPKITLANMDADSPLVEYTGEHELLFSDIEVLAVLACPPYHEGIGQTNALTGTTIGYEDGKEIAKEDSASVSVGISVGVELEDDTFTQSKFATDIRLDVERGTRTANIAEKTFGIAYSSGAGEDKVILTVFPFDVYYYRVICAPAGSDLKVGGKLTVSIPREPQVLSVSREYYNANNGDHPDIDASVLGHRIGDVRSYPSAPWAGGINSSRQTVGQGTGYETARIYVGAASATESWSTVTLSRSSEIGAGGVVVGAYWSHQYGYSYRVTNRQGTSYEGVVNDIPPGYSLTTYGYVYGLSVYPFTLGPDRFTVVNYWVE